MSHRVVITGMGWITPVGHSIEAAWPRLLAGESGIARTSLFDASTFPTSISAEVKDFRLSDQVRTSEQHQSAGRNTHFALAAAQQAWTNAALETARLDLDRVGIYLGSGEGSLDFDAFTTANLSAWRPQLGAVDMVRWGQLATELMNVVRELEQEPNMPLSHLALLTGARGPALNCLTACAASTQAIGEAMHILRRGDADVMIGGGAHSMIHPFGVTGFNRLTALSTANGDPARASRPFDAQPDALLGRRTFQLAEVRRPHPPHRQPQVECLAIVVEHANVDDGLVRGEFLVAVLDRSPCKKRESVDWRMRKPSTLPCPEIPRCFL